MEFSIHILGSNSAKPFHNRFPSSQYIRFGKYVFLLDCGEGCQFRLQEYKLSSTAIHAIFITHLHGDHLFGLPGLLTSMSLNRREAPLHIYAPVGIEKFVKSILETTESTMTYPINIHEIDTEVSNIIYQLPHLEVISVPLDHRIPTSGFLMKERNKLRNIKKDELKKRNIPVQYLSTLKRGKDVRTDDGTLLKYKELTHPPKRNRSYAYITDTLYKAELSELLQGVDYIYHDATFLNELSDKAESTMHTTVEQAATLAMDSDAGNLLLGHFSSRYYNLEPLLQEARNIFPSTELAIDGKVFTINYEKREGSK